MLNNSAQVRVSSPSQSPAQLQVFPIDPWEQPTPEEAGPEHRSFDQGPVKPAVVGWGAVGQGSTNGPPGRGGLGKNNQLTANSQGLGGEPMVPGGL